MSADNKDVELLTEHEKKRAIIKRTRRNDGSLCALAYDIDISPHMRHRSCV